MSDFRESSSSLAAPRIGVVVATDKVDIVGELQVLVMLGVSRVFRLFLVPVSL